MSRAFVKEESGGPGEPLPPRRISEHPNYVTPRGLRQLREEQAALTLRRRELLERAAADEAAADELPHVDRDLAYFSARLASAMLVDHTGGQPDEVTFGASVTVREEGQGASASSRTFTIVGEDEANAEAGLVSYVSPLARALAGARVGQTVTWKRPLGDLVLTVERITCDA